MININTFHGLLAGVLLCLAAAAFAGQAVTTADVEIPVAELELRLKPLTRAELKVEADAWLQVLQAKVSEISAAEIASKFKKAQISLTDKVGDALDDLEKAKQALAGKPDDAEAQAALVEARKVFEETLAEAKAKIRQAEQDKSVKAVADTASKEVEAAKKQAAAEADADEKRAAPEPEPEAAAQDTEIAAVRAKLEAFEAEQAEVRRQVLENLTGLRTEQAALVNRMNTVVDAFEKKGGAAEEVEEYRQYVKAVSGIEVDVSDTQAIWTTATGWLMSAEGGLRWARNLAVFVVTVLVFMLLANMAAKALAKVLARSRQVSQLLGDFVVTSIRRLIVAIGIIIGLAAMEVNIGPLLAVIGAAGFVIAFALQNSLGNFASGILILVFRPFDVGDVIEVAGVLGEVKSMNLLSIQIRTPDNKVVIVANNQVWGNVITNVTGSQTRRVDLVFGIAYQDDIELAQRVMTEVVEAHEKVLKDPAPVIRVHELGDSSVNFVCRPWVRTRDYWEVYWDLTKQVKQRFDKEGISIPFPQRDVHVISAGDNA